IDRLIHSVYNRHCHTRRSSVLLLPPLRLPERYIDAGNDLEPLQRRCRVCDGLGAWGVGLEAWGVGLVKPGRCTGTPGSSLKPHRSEEHTSELQSRENLV